jgi:hypothetical protein
LVVRLRTPGARWRARRGPGGHDANKDRQQQDQAGAQEEREGIQGEPGVGLGDPGQPDGGEWRDQDGRRDRQQRGHRGDDHDPKHAQRRQLYPGHAERPKDWELRRLQVDLAGQRLPQYGQRSQRNQGAQHPQGLGLKADRSLDPGRLGLLHHGDIHAAKTRGGQVMEERVAVGRPAAQPDQQRGIRRRRGDAVGSNKRRGHVHATKVRRGADGRELAG